VGCTGCKLGFVTVIVVVAQVTGTVLSVIIALAALVVGLKNKVSTGMRLTAVISNLQSDPEEADHRRGLPRPWRESVVDTRLVLCA
jgi:hypothetical protein